MRPANARHSRFTRFDTSKLPIFVRLVSATYPWIGQARLGHPRPNQPCYGQERAENSRLGQRGLNSGVDLVESIVDLAHFRLPNYPKLSMQPVLELGKLGQARLVQAYEALTPRQIQFNPRCISQISHFQITQFCKASLSSLTLDWVGQARLGQAMLVQTILAKARNGQERIVQAYDTFIPRQIQFNPRWISQISYFQITQYVSQARQAQKWIEKARLGEASPEKSELRLLILDFHTK